MSSKSRIVFFIISFVFFVTYIGISLNASGYVLPFGWRPSAQKFVPPDAYPGNYAICDRDLIEKGFPLTFVRPYEDASDCTDQYNDLAIAFNVLLALAVSLSTSWVLFKTIGKKVV